MRYIIYLYQRHLSDNFFGDYKGMTEIYSKELLIYKQKKIKDFRKNIYSMKILCMSLFFSVNFIVTLSSSIRHKAHMKEKEE